MHASIHTYIHACMHASIHTYIHACIHACMHTYIHTYRCTVRAYYLYIINRYINKCIYIYTIYYFHPKSESISRFSSHLQTSWLKVPSAEEASEEMPETEPRVLSLLSHLQNEDGALRAGAMDWGHHLTKIPNMKSMMDVPEAWCDSLWLIIGFQQREMSGDRLLGAYELKNYKKLAGFMHGVCYSKIPASHIIDISTQPGMIIPYLPSGNLT